MPGAVVCGLLMRWHTFDLVVNAVGSSGWTVAGFVLDPAGVCCPTCKQYSMNRYYKSIVFMNIMYVK